MKFSIAILMNLSFCFVGASISNVQNHSRGIKNVGELLFKFKIKKKNL